MKKSKIIIAIIAIILPIFGFSYLSTNSAHATDSACTYLSPDSPAYRANGCGGSSTTELSDVVIGIINGVVGALSLVAVIFIVVGGVNYMTSQGDPGKTKKAKDTILYAVIGLIIAVLAFAIVNFVIVNIINHTEDNNSNNNSSSTIEGGGPI
ncbi:hypothetical protein IJI18_03165 [Candidatus Saccharibacteria bacterium]|nr:hypothetical protein [Candidatus Saccharibacteria bacterium]